MARGPRSRFWVVNVLSLVVCVLVGSYACGKRVETTDSSPPETSTRSSKPEPLVPPASPEKSSAAAPAPASAAAMASAVASTAPVVNRSAKPPSKGAALVASAAPSSQAPAKPADKKDDDEKDKKADPEPIDYAVAPDGGVPFHPDATDYRSPFAKPGVVNPVRVKVAMTLNSVDDYDVKTGKFTADFFVSLTSTEPMPQIELQAVNGNLEKKTPLADRPTFKLFRMAGDFKSPPDLRKYPFDSQDLKIVLEDDRHGTDTVRLQVDKERTKLARGFRAVGWQVGYIEARSISQLHGDRFEGDDLYYGRYVLTLGLDRFASSAVFKVFVPAFVIVLISILGMWVPPDEMEVRSNSGGPMLAGAVLFHYSLMQDLPATSYFMRADKLMLGVYISLVLGMASTWWMFLVDERSINKVFRVARVLVPVLSLLTMIVACTV